MIRWLVLVALVAPGCRGKDSGGAPVGSASTRGSAPAKGGTWSAVIGAGTRSSVLSLASGPLGTFVVTLRDGSAIAVNGKELVAASKDEGEAYIQLDAQGAPVGGVVIDGTGQPSPIAVGASDAIAGIAAVSVGGKGAIATLPGTTVTPVDGNVDALARTSSGAVWIAGRNWGSDDPLADGKCDRKSFVARRAHGGSVEVVACDSAWTDMHLAAAGDDAVLCASGASEINGTKIDARTFLARLASDGKVAWVHPINEIGDSRCDDITVASDGDIVISGMAAENVDFTEGAKAKGDDKAGGFGLDRVWLARFAGDGKRRWARVIARSTVGSQTSLDADRSGNAVLMAGTNTQLDLGGGPIGPNGALVVASIDRDGKVNGLLSADHATTEHVAVDAQDGLVIAVATGKPITIAGVALQPPGDTEYIGVVRVPLPLPAP